MMKSNVLDILEKKLALLLKYNLLPEKSYLAGGTAVYLYLKHRVSVDLDFFTPTAFNSDLLIHKIKECFDHVQVELMEKNTVILYISEEKVQFSLFLFPYDNLVENQTVTLQDSTICTLASLEDIEAMKAVAISQRGSVKDFIDFYFIVKKTGHHFDDIFKGVMKKYNLDNTYEYQIKTSFVYFEDAEKEIDNIIMIGKDKKKKKLTEKEWEKIKKFFTEYIK
jgi:predicted nucleotidyltransferase component of viral defense system